MAVTYPLTQPSVGGFRHVTFRLNGHAAITRSPLTRTTLSIERPGSFWAAEFTLAPMVRSDAALWTAFFTSLRGRIGTFYARDQVAALPQGTGVGTPLVKGASQTGHTLLTDGWGLSQTPLKAGDYFEVAARYHMVVEDVVSDGFGNGTLEIEPALRESPADNAPITVTNPRVIMRLASNQMEWNQSLAEHYGFTFAAIEALST